MQFGRPGLPATPLDWKVGIEAVYHRNALAILEECIARLAQRGRRRCGAFFT